MTEIPIDADQLTNRADLSASALHYGWDVIETDRPTSEVYRLEPFSILIEFGTDGSVIKALLFVDPIGKTPLRRVDIVRYRDGAKRAKVRHWLHEYSRR